MSHRMTEIRDPVHGYVKLEGPAEELADAPQIQRLRWIKQLGLANLVYPGANHTRFEHSLGVYHLAGALGGHLGLDEEEMLKVKTAALLHDVGHGPFSHAAESALAPYMRKEHESIIDLLRRGELRDILDKYGLRPSEMQSLIDGKRLGQIINSEIDVDRMDYLIRDSHYTGVAYGVIDHQRVIKKMIILSGRLAVEAGGVAAASSLLISRLLMHPTVYYHHVCRISECMISSGIRFMIEGGIKAEEIRAMDDAQLFAAMDSSGGHAADMVERVKSRRLFKRAVYVGLGEIEPSLLKVSEKRIAQEIADQAGVNQEHLLVDNPRLPSIAEGSFPALVNGELIPLRQVSPLVDILERAQRVAWRFGIYCPKDEQERVSIIAAKYLNLKKNAVQHTLADIDYG